MAEGASRRDLLRALALSPLGLVLGARDAAAQGTPTPQDFLDSADRLEAEVGDRLAAVARVRPSAQAFARSVAADRARHEALRARIRRHRGLPPRKGASAVPPENPESLSALRAAQKTLLYAHVEGLPGFLDAPREVHRLGKAMIDFSRQLTVIDLWIERERHA